MANTHDPLSHHTTDVLPLISNGPYQVSNVPCGEKRGYQANS